MVDNRVTVVSPEDQDRRLHTLPVWARERIQRAESALAARDAALTLIMRNADAAKEPCSTDGGSHYMTRLTLTARTRLNTYANVSRKQSDKETFDMSIQGVPDEFEELMPCSACPDGYVWDSNGPTCKPCPVCKGYAALRRNGAPIEQSE